MYLKLGEKDRSHFIIILDDYIIGGIKKGASTLNHEFGHIEDVIQNQVNAAWFMTGGRSINYGHENGNLSGKKAEQRENEILQ